MRYAITTADPAALRDAREAGFDYAEVAAIQALMPDKPESEFEDTAAALIATGIPVESHNCFLQGNMRCVGPDADHAAIEAWAEICFGRMNKLGSSVMVFGSGAARTIPDGWPREKAEEQFASLLGLLGRRAEAHGVSLVVEPLARAECNFINTVDEGARLARSSGSDVVGVLADNVHWERNGETADTIIASADRFRHAHVATLPSRRVPGVEPHDFGPFFAALRAIGYDGRVSVESWISEPERRVERLRSALEILRAAAAGQS